VKIQGAMWFCLFFVIMFSSKWKIKANMQTKATKGRIVLVELVVVYWAWMSSI
jgi:hypothetical protein